MSKKRTTMTINKRLHDKYISKLNLSKLLETMLFDIEQEENNPPYKDSTKTLFNSKNGSMAVASMDELRKYFKYLKDVCSKDEST
jgi:hypothetical protein